jgi:hypothetical protein
MPRNLRPRSRFPSSETLHLRGLQAGCLALSVLAITVFGAWAAAMPPAAAETTTTTTSPDVGDAAATTLKDESSITSVEGTIDGWNLACSTTEDLDQDLGYANDDLAQGDPAGARFFLQMAENDAHDGDAGYVPSDDETNLDKGAAPEMDDLPTNGDTGAPVTASPSLPNDSSCPSLASYNASAVEQAAAQVVGSAPTQTASTTPHSSQVTLDALTTGASEQLADAPGQPAACQEPGVDETANNLRKLGLTVVGMAGDEIPKVGGLVEGLADILWPESGPDLWSAMTQCVDAKIQQAIDQSVQSLIDTKLAGMRSAISLYSTVLKNPRNADGSWAPTVQQNVLAQYRATLTVLVDDLPTFQPSIRPYLYLPEYVEAMTLVLGMLRDGIMDAKNIGLDAASVSQFKTDMANDIKNGTDYVNNQIDAYHKAVSTSTDSKYSSIDNYDAVASLDQSLLPATVDQTFYWPYFNPVTYPNPVHPVDKRVTYTIAYGYIDNNKPVTLNQAGAGAGVDPITHVDMWGWDRLDALKIAYGSNPASKLGGTGGAETSPHGTGFTVEPAANGVGPIYKVTGFYDPHAVPIALEFFWGPSAKDPKGGNTGMLGYQGVLTNAPYNDVNLRYQPFDAEFPGQVLDYAKVEGVSSGYNSANCVVFGFRYPDSFTPPLT